MYVNNNIGKINLTDLTRRHIPTNITLRGEVVCETTLWSVVSFKSEIIYINLVLY